MSSSPKSAPRSKPAAARLLSQLGLVFAVVLLAALAGAGWAGYQAGLEARAGQAAATQAVELQTQFNLGAADLQAGHFEVAASRFEYILSIDPAYPGAHDKLLAAQAGLHITATAPPPTSRPQTTPAATPAADPAQWLALAEQSAAASQWDAVLNQVTHLRVIDPAYEELRANQLIFTALRGRGLERIQGDQLEAGIFDLDQAAHYGTLDLDARNYRAWARLYLAGKSYYGLDWAKTVDIFQQLYVLAPNFKDTSPRLREATLKYAAQLSAAGDACGAATHYAAALALVNEPQLEPTLTAAQKACAAGVTPSPEPAPTATH